MNHTFDAKTETDATRRRVVELPGDTAPEPGVLPAEAEILRLLHELQARQVELAVQNAALAEARDTAVADLATYTDLYDSAPVGYLTLNRDGTIKNVNLVGAGMLGWDRSLLIGWPFQLFVPDESRSAFAAFLDKVDTSRTREACEMLLLARRTAPTWVRIEAIAAAPGKEYRLVLIDIKDRKQSMDTLEKSEAGYGIITDTADNWEYWLSPDEKVLYVSPSCKRITGHDIEEFVNNPELFTSIIHPDDLHRVVADLYESKTARKSTKMEFRILRPDGAVRWIEHVCQPLFDDTGCFLGTRGSNHDITERMKLHEMLQKNHDLQYTLSHQAPGVIFQYRLFPDGRSCFPYASAAMMDIYEFTPEEVREDASPMFAILHPDDFDGVVSSIRESARSLRPWCYEFRVILPRQGLRWRQGDARPQRLADGSTLWHGFISDVTGRKQVEERLRASEERFRKVFDEGPLGMAIIDLDYRLTRVNRNFCMMLGYTEEELTGLRFAEITHPDDVDKDLSLACSLMKNEIPLYKIQIRYTRKDKQMIWVNLTASFARSDSGEPLYGIKMIEDITDRKRMEADLIKAATFDHLTGIFNRKALENTLETEQERFDRYERVFSVIMMDLDGFKLINDTYGHQKGDQVLAAVADAIRTSIRSVDIAGRWGGDEFMIMVPETDIHGVILIADKILKKIEGILIENVGKVKASFGVTSYRKNETVGMMLKRADLNLYNAKKRGGNCVDAGLEVTQTVSDTSRARASAVYRMI